MAAGPSVPTITRPPGADRAVVPPIRSAVAVVAIAVGLTWLFWFPLWTGGGLVGGDIYAYFLPQKAYFAQQLRAGSLPAWNHLIGWGYPQIAESQTGVFYPLHWPLYGLLELNTAFNVSLIAHYVLAFAFAWMYARAIGLSWAGSVLAATVYVYGWFPPRICLEWTILGGTWLPLALWLVERFVSTRKCRYPLWLAVVLAVQMLAGHYTLAFVTQLTVLVYTPLRLWVDSASRRVHPAGTSFAGPVRTSGAIVFATTAAFGLASIQLFPTWELKQHSQRQTVSAEHDPGYGYLPPRYLMQAVAPWQWYQDDAAFAGAATFRDSRTNRVEAHLYFGLVPLALAAWGLWRAWREGDRRLTIWLPIALAALVYTTGMLIPITRHLPGFSFFEGPGRFGLVPALAAGLWAGRGLSVVLQRRRRGARVVVGLVVAVATLADLWLVSRQLVFDPWLAAEAPRLSGPQSKYVYLTADPPLGRLEASPLRRFFADGEQPVRLFSPGKNLPSLMGIATLPTYLGLGPAAYYEPRLMFPGTLNFENLRPPSNEQMDWLRRGGVTHLLAFSSLSRRECDACGLSPAWQGSDPFVNRALARPGDAGIWVYGVQGTRGRTSWTDSDANPPPKLIELSPSRVTVETEGLAEGRVLMTDLNYPGWSVMIDGTLAAGATVEGVFRGVDLLAGRHLVIWDYRPNSLRIGAAVSVATVLILGICSVRAVEGGSRRGRPPVGGSRPN